MKYYLIIILAFVSLLTLAQKNELRINLGTNTSNYLNQNNELNYSYSALPGLHYGLNYSRHFTEKSHLSFGLWYSKIGIRQRGYISGVDKDIYSTSLAIPILYSYNLTKTRLQPYFSVGVMPKAMAENTTKNYPYGFDGESNTYRKVDRAWHMDIAGGIGLSYKLTPKIKLYAEILYTYTFAVISKNSPASNVFSVSNYPSPNTYYYSVGVGYSFFK